MTDIQFNIILKLISPLRHILWAIYRILIIMLYCVLVTVFGYAHKYHLVFIVMIGSLIVELLIKYNIKHEFDK